MEPDLRMDAEYMHISVHGWPELCQGPQGAQCHCWLSLPLKVIICATDGVFMALQLKQKPAYPTSWITAYE